LRSPAFDRDEAYEALRLAMHKLPLKCKVVKKETEKGGWKPMKGK
jgi:Ribosomal protein L16/L10E